VFEGSGFIYVCARVVPFEVIFSAALFLDLLLCTCHGVFQFVQLRSASLCSCCSSVCAPARTFRGGCCMLGN